MSRDIHKEMNKLLPGEKTFGEQAVEWGKEQGIKVPERGTPEWKIFYEKFIDWAFVNFPKTID